MKDLSLNLVMPKGTTWRAAGDNPNLGVNARMPYCRSANVVRGDNFVTEHAVKDGMKQCSSPYKIINQEIKNFDDASVKLTTISPDEYYAKFPVHKTVQRLTKDGHYSVARQVGEEIVGGYEMHPLDRKLMTGFKGKLETLAMKIGTNSNGCERPVLRRVAGFMLDTLRKVK